MDHRYFIGIGSNIAPEQNIPRIVDMLLNRCHRFVISPVIRTEPVGINSRHDFINAVAYIETDLDITSLKSQFNHIEEQLGRDRQDACKKIKDRTADIDILLELGDEADSLDVASIPGETYVRPLFTILAQHLSLLGEQATDAEALDTVDIHLNGASFGHTAAAINYNAGACNVVVLQ